MAMILISGANRGIGLEMARQYSNRGDEVIGVCRVASDGLRALGQRVIEGMIDEQRVLLAEMESTSLD